jgi:DNA-binding PadR family transcriptional regulator
MFGKKQKHRRKARRKYARINELGRKMLQLNRSG